ncbi:isopentenyl-diphosphate Delta-isomerase [Nocardia sp. CDC159]|uniref:Isopentenyl-diphosphate Delta-isomerase n=1 Tax=Nocardia pulmonis TaxID=2951408 RepID=A0A9X2ED86_9NOCA|nr:MULTISPECIES: isopentenyl-diphosphate Delta-isomerase [Nocardia]MCM6778324.1 isopentenyl-diphosphate Delta-isomerase [Nocardia pulmonis]MCM6791280.1 isopentenyl-diphosphate Delta-isomerase [Nocardia sp. CDC159]
MSLPSETTDREALLVELVDEQGRATGACPVAEAHTAPGRLHRAFSVLLFDAAGRVLLQQRAAVKTRFPLQWANTCCGHPAPGESVVAAARTRLTEELGIQTPVHEVGTFRYRAGDTVTGRVEFEWDHVLIGRFDGEPPQPDPAEVADFAWVRPEALAAAIEADPQRYTPWLSGVLTLAERSN